MTGMGRKTTEREKNKNRKGKLGKESHFFDDKKINIYGMPRAQSPKRLTLICSKYYGIALAMTNWKFGQVGKKEMCVCKSCASLTRTRIPKIDMFQMTGRRPAH